MSADPLGEFEAGWTGAHDERWQIARQAVIDRLNRIGAAIAALGPEAAL